MGATGVERTSTLAGNNRISAGLHGQVLGIVGEFAPVPGFDVTKSDQV